MQQKETNKKKEKVQVKKRTRREKKKGILRSSLDVWTRNIEEEVFEIRGAFGSIGKEKKRDGMGRGTGRGGGGGGNITECGHWAGH